MTIPLVNGVNPLQTTLTELGIVSGRVALLLRSAEIQPVFVRFVLEYHSVFTPSPLVAVLLQGLQVCCGVCQGGQGAQPPPVVRYTP